jgi:hypothetical protein
MAVQAAAAFALAKRDRVEIALDSKANPDLLAALRGDALLERRDREASKSA